eukprot:scaffold2134_cov93-Cylindrotheca_fusiformis.AAC.19
MSGNLLSRWTTDASNAMEDMYGTMFLGDDAGDADRRVVILQPPPLLLGRRSWCAGGGSNHLNNMMVRNTLGLSFVNIQNRAYVLQVEEGSPADVQGVRRKDSVQYAAVLANEWQHPLTDDYEDISKQALEREATGQRISYNDLKRILERGSTTASAADAFLSPPANNAAVPTTISVDRASSTAKRRGDLATPRPIVLVLRRTRKRSQHNNNTNNPNNNTIRWRRNIWPRFRLDDECDVATDIVASLATTTAPREAKRIREQLQTCTGIAFLRSNKVTLGLSLQGGSGIVLSKLPDGSWSPPSAIGTWGVGVGLQLGMEVAHTLILLQTQEALEHFLRGASFQVGVGVGAAIAQYGREAIGAASVSGALCGSTQILDFSKEDEYNVENDGTQPPQQQQQQQQAAEWKNSNKLINGVTPMMAYAMSEGLYVGISLEGNKLFTRHDVNARVYQYYQNPQTNHHHHNNHNSTILANLSSGSNHNSSNINNNTAPIVNAAAVGVSPQEILQGKVPVPPEAHMLIASLIAAEYQHDVDSLPPLPKSKHWNCQSKPKKTLDSQEEQQALVQQFQQFLLGGVAVTQLPSTTTSTTSSRKDLARTLWLYFPGPGMSSELGFISKHSERKQGDPNHPFKSSSSSSSHHNNSSDNLSTASEDLTLDSALMDTNSVLYGAGGAGAATTGGPTTRVELSLKHSVALTDVVSLSQQYEGIHDEFLDRTVCLTTCKNKKLVFLTQTPQEATLLMNGLSLLLEHETARLKVRGGVGRKLPTPTPTAAAAANNTPMATTPHGKPPARKAKQRSVKLAVEDGGYSSSEEEEEYEDEDAKDVYLPESLPVGWKSWGRIPGRSYLKMQAALNSDEACPKYAHGQLLVRDIAKSIHLPLPLALCRILLLDSSSPVITQWQQDGGDADLEKTPWTFPPATPREMDQYQSEHQLIASGSMIAAHRTISYARKQRSGITTRLTETHIVDSDDSEKLAFSINERMPRRGFSVKVKVAVRSYNNECDATIMAELRPIGKNMSNPTAVHKAFLLVLDELTGRYGTGPDGLLEKLLSGVANLPPDAIPRTPESLFAIQKQDQQLRDQPLQQYSEEKKETDGVVKLEDMLKNTDSNRVLNTMDSSGTSSMNEKRPTELKKGSTKKAGLSHKPAVVDEPMETSANAPVMIEVKPLPKIRLSLMPSPREEDEDKEAEEKKKKKLKKKKDKSTKSWSKKRKDKKVTNL